MSAQDRGNGYIFHRPNTSILWCGYSLRGKNYQESTGERDEDAAKKYLKNRIREVGADLIGAKKFTPPKNEKIEIGALVDALREDYKLRGKLSAQSDSHLDRVKEDFEHVRALGLTAEAYAKYINDRLANNEKPSFVQRTTQLLKQAFKLAVRQKRFNHGDVPHLVGLTFKNARQNFITEKQLETLLANLPNDGLRDFVDWLGATGMRCGEAKLLRWSMIQANELRIPATICKNGFARSLPVDVELLEGIIKRRRAARTFKHADGSTPIFSDFIFHRAGRPVAAFRKTWATACKNAGIVGAVPHDLRRTATVRLIRAGVPQVVAMKITGHRTDSMFRRYGILETSDLRAGLKKAGNYRKEAVKEESKVVSM